jgi:RNA polymerase primary sigma factor
MVTSGNGTSQLEYLIDDKRCKPPDHELIQQHLVHDIEQVLNTLDEKEADIIRMRYGFGDRKSMSLSELGDHYNVSKERIRQIEKKAIGSLKQPDMKALLSAYVA